MTPSIRHYFDYNATAPLRDGVREAMVDAWGKVGNASSIHAEGRAARALLDQSRATVASWLNADAAQIIFCGSGSEANNHALRECGAAHVLVSAIEHDCVRSAQPTSTIIAVDQNGLVDVAALDTQLKTLRAQSTTNKIVVACMMANNETGVIQPIDQVVQCAKQYAAHVHVDAVCAAAKMPLDVKALDVDSLAVAAHKMGGPIGIAALVVKPSVPLKPLIKGGGQERNLRAGTQAVALAVGWAKAIQHHMQHRAAEWSAMATLRHNIEQQLSAAGAKIVAQQAERLPQTICVTHAKLRAVSQVMQLDLAGCAVSAGSACSSGTVKASHVLKAMGLSAQDVANSIRISFGPQTNEHDKKALLNAYLSMNEMTTTEEMM